MPLPGSINLGGLDVPITFVCSSHRCSFSFLLRSGTCKRHLVGGEYRFCGEKVSEVSSRLVASSLERLESFHLGRVRLVQCRHLCDHVLKSSEVFCECPSPHIQL